MPRRTFSIPLSIVLFLAFVLVGTYFVRRQVLRRHMLTAMERRDAAMIMSLARGWPSPVNVSDADGLTPLHAAVCVDDLSLARELLARGAALEARTTSGWTPLHYAMFRSGQNNARAMALLLLRSGADATGKLLDDNRTFLHSAVSMGWDDIAEVLVVEGADVRARDLNGTPLHWVQSVDTARLLLDRGADVNAARGDGMRPLDYAAMAGHTEIVKLLIVRGAEINAKTLHGKTVLKRVRENPYNVSPSALNPVIDVLIEHGATE